MWENHKHGSDGVSIVMKQPNILGGVRIMVSTKRAPSKAYKLQLVKIQSKQSLTNSLESISASVAVTKQMKPDSEMYQAAT